MAKAVAKKVTRTKPDTAKASTYDSPKKMTQPMPGPSSSKGSATSGSVTVGATSKPSKTSTAGSAKPKTVTRVSSVKRFPLPADQVKGKLDTSDVARVNTYINRLKSVPAGKRSAAQEEALAKYTKRKSSYRVRLGDTAASRRAAAKK